MKLLGLKSLFIYVFGCGIDSVSADIEKIKAGLIEIEDFNQLNEKEDINIWTQRFMLGSQKLRNLNLLARHIISSTLSVKLYNEFKSLGLKVIHPMNYFFIRFIIVSIIMSIITSVFIFVFSCVFEQFRFDNLNAKQKEIVTLMNKRCDVREKQRLNILISEYNRSIDFCEGDKFKPFKKFNTVIITDEELIKVEAEEKTAEAEKQLQQKINSCKNAYIEAVSIRGRAVTEMVGGYWDRNITVSKANSAIAKYNLLLDEIPKDKRGSMEHIKILESDNS